MLGLKEGFDLQSQVRSNNGKSRHDFLLAYDDFNLTCEVKTAPNVVKLNDKTLSVFPWGNSALQVTPDKEKCVSARLIKHIQELTEIASSKDKSKQALILFIIPRQDVMGVAPFKAMCPIFAKYLLQAKLSGVQILAHKIMWDDNFNCIS